MEEISSILLSLKKTSNAKLMLKFLDKKTKEALAQLVATLMSSPVSSETQYMLVSEFS